MRDTVPHLIQLVQILFQGFGTLALPTQPIENIINANSAK